MKDLPDINWIEAAENPWGVPLLDVRPMTLNILSTTKDPILAKNLSSLMGSDGLSFIGVQPSVDRTFLTNIEYKKQSILADGVFFSPSVMEHKWALYHHNNTILFVRSWLKEVQAIANVDQSGENVKIMNIKGFFVSPEEEPEFTINIFEFLMRTHGLGIQHPVPLPKELAENPKEAAIWCISHFGNMAFFATPHEIKLRIPDVPLRTDSLYHISIARGDIEKVKVFLDQGFPKELLSKDGLSGLHWALGSRNPEILKFLLDQGISVDIRSDEGATPLMNAIQDGNLDASIILIEYGANIDAIDHRGFTALHRAAERGIVDLVKFLLSRGASKDIIAEGYTPLKLAEKENNKKIINLLKD